MVKKPRRKSPEGWKEHTGVAIKSVLCPAIAAWSAWGILASTEWRIEIKLLLGLLAWWFWLRPVFTWLLSPLWNSLYVPRPDFPEDEGVVNCEAFLLPTLKSILICGIAGEMIEWDESITGNHLDKVYRMKYEKKDSLVLLGEVKLKYSFDGYHTRQKHVSYYRNTPSIEYKWPRYKYHLIDGGDYSILKNNS